MRCNGFVPVLASSRDGEQQGERQMTKARGINDGLVSETAHHSGTSTALDPLPLQHPSRGLQPAVAPQQPVHVPNEYWAEEIASIRRSLSIVFGPSVICAIMKKWDLTKDRYELHALQHETSNGKPLGYAMLISKDKTAVDQLLLPTVV